MTLNKPLHQGMAETDEINEFGREPGFLNWFLNGFCPDSFSNVTHGGSTKMSAECSIMERFKITKIDLKLSKCLKIV